VLHETARRLPLSDLPIWHECDRDTNPMGARMRQPILLALLGMFIPMAPAWSDGFGWEPSIACSFLAEQGLRERGGYRKSGSIYQCRTQRHDLIGGGEVNNSIRYLAYGDAATVTRLELELQVNSMTAVQRANRTLVDYAAALTQAALHTGLPGEIESAILSAVDGRWTVEGRPVTLQRRVAGGSVYELIFRIQ
jgi:hypothetical protein